MTAVDVINKMIVGVNWAKPYKEIYSIHISNKIILAHLYFGLNKYLIVLGHFPHRTR
jgi:hypothetical protein